MRARHGTAAAVGGAGYGRRNGGFSAQLVSVYAHRDCRHCCPSLNVPTMASLSMTVMPI
ncbi:hypothetical protein GXW84_30625 [Rhodococcus sp. IEGM 248]|nr:hypothetical protein [Rhodococcus sp. IEGM 248]